MGLGGLLCLSRGSSVPARVSQVSDGRAVSLRLRACTAPQGPGAGSVLWRKRVPRTQHGPRLSGLGGPRAAGLGSVRRRRGAPGQVARASLPRPVCFVREVFPPVSVMSREQEISLCSIRSLGCLEFFAILAHADTHLLPLKTP